MGQGVRGDATKKRSGKQAFIEVRVGDGTAKPVQLVDTVLSNARVVRVPAGIDAAQLRTIVEVVESC